MQRRDFLRTFGVLTTLGLTAGSLRQTALADKPASLNAPHAHGGFADTPPVVDESFRYRGRRVEVLRRAGRANLRSAVARDDGAQISLAIDGQEQGHHIFMKAGKGYVSHMLPYTTYQTPRALARALLDHDGTLFVL